MSEDRAAFQNRTEVRRETRLPFADPNYQPPTPAEFREVMRLLGLTGSQAAALLGVEANRESGSRTIRRWAGGEREPPYSAWRLLLIEAGMAIRPSDTAIRRMIADGCSTLTAALEGVHRKYGDAVLEVERPPIESFESVAYRTFEPGDRVTITVRPK